MAQLPIHTKCQIITRITRINILKNLIKKSFCGYITNLINKLFCERKKFFYISFYFSKDSYLFHTPWAVEL